jgi:hypothetical protein
MLRQHHVVAIAAVKSDQTIHRLAAQHPLVCRPTLREPRPGSSESVAEEEESPRSL